MKTLIATCLLALAAIAPAQAAEPTASAPADCITLSADQQLVRAGASRSILLRNADQHFVVHFRNSCDSAAISPTLTFETAGQEGQLCSAAGSVLKTRTQSCEIASLEPISAESYARKARNRR
jgi:hypothetical protein